jgi:hypothetical protein
MTHFKTWAGLLVLALVPAAFAADASHPLTLTKGVAVNGTAVQAGDYKMKWTGSGDNVDVSIARGKHVLATSPGHVVALDNAPAQDTLYYRQNADGSQSLSEVRFGGKKFAIVLGQQTASAAMSNSQGSSTTTK